MVDKLTFYYHPMCGGCMEVKPLIKEIAVIKGWKYSEVNVEHCKTKICDDIQFVPTIFLDDKKLDFKEIDTLLTKELK